MAHKQFELDQVGQLTIYKRRGSRTIRLTVVSDGSVRVTIPVYLPYQAGLAFAEARKAWILAQPVSQSYRLQNAQDIGKQHRLLLTLSFSSSKIYTRVIGPEIRVIYPHTLDPDSMTVQAAATNACIRALRSEAETLLPARIAQIAQKYSFEYKSVRIKRLKGRWGSCDQERNIVINLYLMQLPWDLIDYVLLHELVHTEHLHHGKDFWDKFTQHEPNAKALRNQIRKYQPNFMPPEA